MSKKEYIKSLVKEAELYRTQSLLTESKKKYLQALQFIQKTQLFSNKEKIVGAIKNKIRILEKDQARITEDKVTPKLSKDVQGLIKRLFSFSNNKEAVRVEGAVALAKFGQHERALKEFHSLLNEGTFPLVSAKNIIRCHMSLKSPDAAINEFGHWVSGDLLSIRQLENIRVFLQTLLEKQGHEAKLPEVVEAPSQIPKTEKKQDDVIDICAVKLKLEDGPQKGNIAEFDVNFQSGNVITVIVSAQQKELVDTLTIGIQLPDMEFYSPIAIFRGSGIVFGKTQIKSGPKKGDYVLDIRVDSA